MELLGYEELNQFLKDHGSLIGGVLAFMGVFVLVRNQNSSTKKTIDTTILATEKTTKATLAAIHLESFEIQKRNYINTIITIMSDIDDLKTTSRFNEDNIVISSIDANIIKVLNTNFRYISTQNFNIMRSTNNYMKHLWAFFHSIYKDHQKILNPEELAFHKEIHQKMINTLLRLSHLTYKEMEKVYDNKIPSPISRALTDDRRIFQINMWGPATSLTGKAGPEGIRHDYIDLFSKNCLRSCNIYLRSILDKVTVLKIDDQVQAS